MAARVRPALHLKDAGHSTDGRTGFGAPHESQWSGRQFVFCHAPLRPVLLAAMVLARAGPALGAPRKAGVRLSFSPNMTVL